MKALVTGGGGFVGGAIVSGLLARGDEVRSFARGHHSALAVRGVDVRRGDLCDREAVLRAVEGVDVVFHAAAKAGVWGAAESFRRPNVIGTQHVLDACRAHGVRKLVFTSSPSVVFDQRSLEGVDERIAYPARFLAPYPATKAEAERAVLGANSPALATVALRPHLVWGPGDPHFVPRLLARARAGKLRRVGDGHWKVDTTFVDNAADAHLNACDALAPNARCAGRAYFISNGEPIAVGEMLDRILAAAGLPPLQRSISPSFAVAAGWLAETAYRLLRRDEEPPITRFLARQLSTAHWFDIGAAKRDLGYRPRVGLDEGMARLAEWLRHDGN